MAVAWRVGEGDPVPAATLPLLRALGLGGAGVLLRGGDAVAEGEVLALPGALGETVMRELALRLAEVLGEREADGEEEGSAVALGWAVAEKVEELLPKAALCECSREGVARGVGEAVMLGRGVPVAAAGECVGITGE